MVEFVEFIAAKGGDRATWDHFLDFREAFERHGLPQVIHTDALSLSGRIHQTWHGRRFTAISRYDSSAFAPAKNPVLPRRPHPRD
jgi:hypothetical protein